MNILIFIFFLVSLKVLALDVRSHEGKIFLVDSSCDLLYKSRHPLKLWANKLNENVSCASSVEPTDTDCQLDVTDCLPGHVVKYQGVRPEKAGPNCWNLVLVMQKVLPSLRYSLPEEMSFYLRSPLCRELSKKEAREPGDVGVIRKIGDDEFNPTEVHAFVEVSNELVYSKNGMWEIEPFALQTKDDMLTGYKVPNRKECRHPNKQNINCNPGVGYFRCQSMQDYLKAHSNIPSTLRNLMKGVNKFEDCVQAESLGVAPLTGEAKENIFGIISALTFYVEDNKDLEKMDSSEKNFIFGSIQLRLHAILEQLKYNSEIEQSERIEDLARAFEKATWIAGIKKVPIKK